MPPLATALRSLLYVLCTAVSYWCCVSMYMCSVGLGHFASVDFVLIKIRLKESTYIITYIPKPTLDWPLRITFQRIDFSNGHQMEAF